jgi:hypothetical protein
VIPLYLSFEKAMPYLYLLSFIFIFILIHEARGLYVEDDFGLQLKETVYALDSSTIDLCLSVFPWARFRKTKAAVKLHTLLDAVYQESCRI